MYREPSSSPRSRSGPPQSISRDSVGQLGPCRAALAQSGNAHRARGQQSQCERRWFGCGSSDWAIRKRPVNRLNLVRQVISALEIFQPHPAVVRLAAVAKGESRKTGMTRGPSNLGIQNDGNEYI